MGNEVWKTWLKALTKSRFRITICIITEFFETSPLARPSFIASSDRRLSDVEKSEIEFHERRAIKLIIWRGTEQHPWEHLS
jgi:hypothetical protein